MRRASAAALRSAMPPHWMPVLPEAPPWLQVKAVSPMTTLTLLERDVELFGDDLGDGDVHALAHLRLAEERGDAAVGQHGDPRIELVRA